MIRVSFRSEAHASSAMRDGGIRLFGIWCRMDGGSPSTIVHLFDYPFEEENEVVREFFGGLGVVKNVRLQKYLSRPDIYTGTRLVDVVLSEPPPRVVNIDGYMCRVWYKGQPLICNLCGTPGHRSSECPNRNKCRLCGAEGHFARSCPNPWGLNPQVAPAEADAPAPVASPVPSNANDSASGSATVAAETAASPSVGASGPSVASLPPQGDPVPPPAAAMVTDADEANGTGQGSDLSIEVSPEIGEFSSSASSSSDSISDFSQDSQSVLANVVPNPNYNAKTSAVVNNDSDNNSKVVNSNSSDDNVLNDDPNSSGVSGEESSSMDTSGASSKRKLDDVRPSDDVVFVRPSRPRSSSREGAHAKKMRDVSVSPSGGRHPGLPAVSPSRPRRT